MSTVSEGGLGGGGRGLGDPPKGLGRMEGTSDPVVSLLQDIADIGAEILRADRRIARIGEQILAVDRQILAAMSQQGKEIP